MQITFEPRVIIAALLLMQTVSPLAAQDRSRAGWAPMPDLILPPRDAPPIWSNTGVQYRSAVFIGDGDLDSDRSDQGAIHRGRPGATEGRGLDIRSATKDFNGIVVIGDKARFRLVDSVVTLRGNGSNDFAGLASGALVDRGLLTLDGVRIRTHGLISSAVTATNHGVLRVTRSTLESGGAPLPAGYKPMLGPGMMSPPPGLGIEGTARTIVLLDNSDSFFRNTKIIGHGWGALSSDGANGYLYVQLDDCDVEMTANGYAAYFDYGARAVFNTSRMRSKGVGAFMAGAANLTLNQSDIVAERDAFIFHSVLVKESDIGTMSVTGGRISAGGAIARVRSANAEMVFDGVDLVSRSGDLIVTEVNPDFFATKVTRRPPGVRVTFRNLSAQGAVRATDGERALELTLSKAQLEGPLDRVILDLDRQSRWKATANSSVTLVEAADLSRIDAAPGATIRARALDGNVVAGMLPSGGRIEPDN